MVMKSGVLMTAVLGSFLGCATDAPETAMAPEPESESPTANVPIAFFQQQVDEYARSLLDRDVIALTALVSTEVRSRADTLHLGLDALVEKQRAAMFLTFDLREGDRPSFQVTHVEQNGDRFAATLSLNGKQLSKPLYFVRDTDGIRLNIAAPGFSKNYRASNSYLVKNQNGSEFAGTTMSCNPNNVFTLPGQTKSVSCYDGCGWWAGTQFQLVDGGGGGVIRSCDWNSWGDDVFIHWTYDGGWRCNDNC